MTRKLSRIVISSVSEKSLSFATKQAMFGTLKRETFYPLPFGHRPIYIRGEAATFISNFYRASPHIYSAALLYFYAPHHHSSFLIFLNPEV